MTAPTNVNAFVASNDTNQSQQTDNKLDQIKSEALKKYQAIQSDRQASYVEGPSTPGTAQALDAQQKAKALLTPGLEAMDTQHSGAIAFKGLESMLLDGEPLAKPAAQFEAQLPKNALTQPSTIDFAPNFMRQLPVGAMLGIVTSSGSDGLISQSFVKVAQKLAAQFATGELRIDNLDFNKSKLMQAMPPQQRQALAEAFKPIVSFLNKQAGAISKGQRPPGESSALDDAEVDADDPTLLGDASSDQQMGSASSNNLYNPAAAATPGPTVPTSAQLAPIPPIPGSLQGQAGQSIGAQIANGMMNFPPGLDIDGIVQMVMSDCELSTEGDLQTMAEGMQTLNAQKSAQRKLEEAYSDATSKMTNEMQTEFAQLQQSGKIGAGWTFDDYSAWRQCAIGEPVRDSSNNLVTDANGNIEMSGPELAQPSPPTLLPPMFAQPKTPAPVSATSTAAGRTPGDVGDDFGLTTAQVNTLQSIYNTYFRQSDPNSSDPNAFSDWLQGPPVGLTEIDPSDDTTTGVAANNKAIDAFLTTLQSDPEGTIGLTSTTDPSSSVSGTDLAAIQNLATALTSGAYPYTLPDSGNIAKGVSQLQELYKKLYLSPDDLNTAASAVAAALFSLKNADTTNSINPALPDVSGVEGADPKHKVIVLHLNGGTDDDTAATQLASAASGFTNVGTSMYNDTSGGVDVPGTNPMDVQLLKCIPPSASGKTLDQSVQAAVTAAQAVQTPIDASLNDAQFFQFGLSTDQISALNTLYTECQKGDFGSSMQFTDINAFIAKVGLQVDDGSNPNTQTQNATAIQQFVTNSLAATPAVTNPDELAAINAQLGLVGNTFDPTVYNLPTGYTAELQKIWVAMPESERTKFQDSFTTFLSAPNGAGLQAGGTAATNEAAIRTYVSGVPSLSAEVGDLDQLENPTNLVLTGTDAGSQPNQLMQDLWNALPQATRTGYGNNINTWLVDTPPKGPGFTSGAYSANMTALQTYCAAQSGTAPDGTSWSNAYTAAAAGTYAPAAATPTDPNADYIQFLTNKGFIGTPPPVVTPAGLSGQSSNGDMGTTLAQNLPTDLGTGAALCSLTDLGNMKQQADDDLQSMSDVSELQTMKLQLIMDQRSKLLESISDVMKKISDTRDEIIANYKSS